MRIPAVWDVRVLVDEEPEISPTLAVFFEGCDLGCRFCMAYDHSRTGRPEDAGEWARGSQTGHEDGVPTAGGDSLTEFICDVLVRAARIGIRTVSFLGGEPSLYLAEIRNAREAAAKAGAHVPPLVLNTNMLMGPDEVAASSEFISLYVADLKFGNDWCASELTSRPKGPSRPMESSQLAMLPGTGASVSRQATEHEGPPRGYFAAATSAIKAAAALPGKRLIVRHLLLPGHFQCCTAPILEWLAREVPGVPVHLLTEYYPNGTSGVPGIERTLTPEEKERAVAVAKGYSLDLMGPTLAEGDAPLPAHPDESSPSLAGTGCPVTIIINKQGEVLIPDFPAELRFLCKLLRGS